MNPVIVKKWKALLVVIDQQQPIKREQLLLLLMDWTKELKRSNDPREQLLYNRYIKPFEKLDLKDYLEPVDNWFLMEDLVQHDLLKVRPRTASFLLSDLGRILWELLVFKSDRACSYCTDDDLRVFSTVEKDKLYFSCDVCIQTVAFIEGDKIPKQLIPAPHALIKAKGILPARIM